MALRRSITHSLFVPHMFLNLYCYPLHLGISSTDGERSVDLSGSQNLMRRLSKDLSVAEGAMASALYTGSVDKWSKEYKSDQYGIGKQAVHSDLEQPHIPVSFMNQSACHRRASASVRTGGLVLREDTVGLSRGGMYDNALGAVVLHRT